MDDSSIENIRKRKLADVPISIPHSFFLDDFGYPRNCDHCGEFIWGLSRQGYSCADCGISIHRHCVHIAEDNCTSRKVEKIKRQMTPNRSGGELTTRGVRFFHQWIDSDLAFSALCSICESSILLDGITGEECTRCHMMVHTSCKNGPVNMPCKPAHRNLIYIPDIDNSVVSDTALEGSFKKGLPGQLPKTELPELVDITSHSCSPSKASMSSSEITSSNSSLVGHRTPLLVFLNRRSGGKEGEELDVVLNRLLSPHQVFDLDKCGGPTPVLEKFRQVNNLRILVCGGDGTVGWVLGALRGMKFSNNVTPPIAVLPLGTGNDLARTLEWGNSYSSSDPISRWLFDIEHATPELLDVWSVKVNPVCAPPKRNKIPKSKNISLEVKEFTMMNYCSFGIDAKVVLDFHTFRERNPSLCFSQLVNKFWYAAYGGKAIFSEADKLEEIMKIEVDNQSFDFPSEVEGIIILNIPYYAGGCDVWGPRTESVFSPVSINDRRLEIVVVTGSFHMATITVDLANAIRLAQGREIKLNINLESKRPLPYHVDGEPLLMENSAEIVISHHHQVKMLRKV